MDIAFMENFRQSLLESFLTAMDEKLTPILEEQKLMREDQGSMREDLKSMHEDHGSMRDDLKSMREDQGSMRDDLKSMREDQGSMRDDLKSMREVQMAMKAQLDRIEQTQVDDVVTTLRIMNERFRTVDKDIEYVLKEMSILKLHVERSVRIDNAG